MAGAVLASGCAAAAPPAVPAAGEAPRFPRLATYYIESHLDPAAREVMVRTDLLVIDAEAGALDRAPIDAIRAARPDALVLAYLTSEEIARTPLAEQPLATARFPRIPPSAWVVEPGSPLTAPVTATDTRLPVASGAAFTLTRPASPFYGSDEPTYLLVGAEHMKLVAIDGDTLVVERGYRSQATPHAAGARVASHVVFFAGTWMLNIASTAPAEHGRTWRDLLAEEAGDLVARGPWNGIFLDVCFEDVGWLNGGLLDLDRDGGADDPKVASRWWSDGMGLLIDRVRAQVGPDVPVVSNPGAQDCPHPALDGILMEGWPIGMPEGWLAWDVGYRRYQRWSRHRRGLTIANGFSPRIGLGTIEAGEDELARTDYAAMRFGLAVALLGDGFYTFDNGIFGHYVAWWYDEYDGAGRGLRWLGAARGPARAQGAVRWREFDHGLAVVNLGHEPARFRAPPGFARLRGRQDPGHNNGAPVEGELAIAARDAYILVRR